MTSSSPRSFTIHDTLFQVLFLTTAGVRLVPKDGESSGSEPVTVVQCHILDEGLNIVAAGRAIKSSDDEFSEARGQLLSLSRALDLAEQIMARWTSRESYTILEDFFEQTPELLSYDALSDNDWNRWFASSSHLEEARVLLAAKDKAASEHSPVPDAIVWQRNGGNDYEPDTFWLKDAKGDTYYMRRSDGFRLNRAYFDTLDVDGFERVPDPRAHVVTAVAAESGPAEPTLLMNDQLRRDAEARGIPLDSPAGALTMSDLSRLYHAMKRTQLTDEQQALSAVPLPRYEPMTRTRERSVAAMSW